MIIIYDEKVTDQNGHFHFPVITRSNLIGMFLPMQFVVAQEIKAYRDDVEYFMWRAVTMDSTANYEARGKPLVVTCELSSELAREIYLREVTHCPSPFALS